MKHLLPSSQLSALFVVLLLQVISSACFLASAVEQEDK